MTLDPKPDLPYTLVTIRGRTYRVADDRHYPDHPANHPEGVRMLASIIEAARAIKERDAKRLVDACCQRWPDLWLTDAISPEGEALLAAVERETGGDV